MARRTSRREKNRVQDLEESCASLRRILGDDETVPTEITFTDGQIVPINTNVYRLKHSGGSTIYQYDVTLEPEILNSRLITILVYSALCPEGGPMSRNEKWQKIIFDGQRIIYSTMEGLDGTYPVKPRKESDKEVIVKITQTRKVEPDDAESLISIYNTAFHKAYHALGLNNFRRKWINENDISRAGNFQIYGGFLPSISSLSGGLSYLLDVATRIDREGTLYDFLRAGIQDESKRVSLQEAARSMQVQTTHRPKKPKTVIVSNILWNQTANNFFFEQENRKTKEKQKISIAEYYRNVYNIECKSDDILIEMVTRQNGVDKSTVFPSSVLKVSGISDAERRAGSTMKEIAQVTRIKPQIRKERLDRFIQELKTNQAAADFLNAWGFEIGESQKIEGRVIQPPTLLFSKRASQEPVRVKINDQLKFQSQWQHSAMYEGVTVKNSILIVASSEKRGQVERDFINNLKKVSEGLAVNLPNIDPRRHCLFVDNTHPNDYCNVIANYFKDCPKEELPTFIFCILPSQDKYRYDKIKHFLSVELGIPSQCVKDQTIFGKANNLSVYTNLAIQMASKLGGVPFRVDVPLGKTMSVGLSLSISRGSAPVCAGTCSFDYGLTHFLSKSKSLQRGENVIPADFLTEFIAEGLDKFNKHNGFYPSHVVVYRDGVSYGQMKKLKEGEVKPIADTIVNVTGVETTSFAFMIAQKHGSIRILREDRPGSYENAGAGTVIVDKIAAKGVAEFYMISHFANQGSASPTRYTIIHHYPLGLSDDKLIELTHFQTIQYPNWNGSIRTPACLMLASRLAEMSKSHLGSDQAKEHLADKLHFL
ncbi:Piwi domain containing protein [Tritrichomonas foetus]|uniref:Piwi domain containing protein n=1 Tax=Tritrichomonas foetus TaxID=1144522 RepID=A0A1J4K264_9EUKA|nr:Piwi domain containing protein [Tritrichomonas foetus]|eukprot:OHT03573.1 Piwi domain containing protein [Tritrichomonas foetus]